jgi:WD40 repeat protein
MFKARTIFLIGFLCLFLVGCAGSQHTPLIWFIYENAETARNGIATINPVTRQERVLFEAPSGVRINAGTKPRSPRLSPDGQKLAYVTISNDRHAIWIMNADGSNPRKLSDDYADAGFFWLNDNQLVLMGHPKPNPYANLLQGEVSLFDLPSGTTMSLIVGNATLPCESDELSVRQLEWEISDNKGSFLALGHPVVQDGTLQMIQDREINLSTVPGRVNSCTSWTDAKEKIAFLVGERLVYDLYFTDDGGKTTKQLTRLGHDYDQAFVWTPALSPDGNWVVFRAELGEAHSQQLPIGTQVGLVRTDNSSLVFLGEWGVYQAPLFWSPDNRYVATIMVPQQGQNPPGEIYLIDVEKKTTIQLTSDGQSKIVFDWR